MDNPDARTLKSLLNRHDPVLLLTLNNRHQRNALRTQRPRTSYSCLHHPMTTGAADFHCYLFALLRPLTPPGVREHDRSCDSARAMAKCRREAERCVDVISTFPLKIARIKFPQAQDESGNECERGYIFHRRKQCDRPPVQRYVCCVVQHVDDCIRQHAIEDNSLLAS